MPLKKSSSKKAVSENIRELHKGPTYSRTAQKFGKARANKQSVAIALHEAGLSKYQKRRKGSAR